MKKIITTVLSFTLCISFCNAQTTQLLGTYTGGGDDGKGAIIKMNPDGTSPVEAHGFPSNLAGYDEGFGTLVAYNGKMYGTTGLGGRYQDIGGIIFEYDPATGVTTKKIDLFEATGFYPYSSLTLVGSKFYGCTVLGGAGGLGVIFEYDPVSNVYTKKIDLTSTLGSYPYCVLQLYNGKLYGTTTRGGANNQGTIFEYDYAANTIVKRMDFSNATTGYECFGGLSLVNNKFYGGTRRLGAGFDGVLFEWDPATNVYTIQYTMPGAAAIGSDFNGRLAVRNNKLYGTTRSGAANGLGAIFEWDPASSTVINKRSFVNASGSSGNYGEMLLYNNKFYSSTTSGGANGVGVVYEWDPATNIYTNKFDLTSSTGSSPNGGFGLLNDKLYALTTADGVALRGSLIVYDPATSGVSNVGNFNKSLGGNPFGRLVVHNGKGYGTTLIGGPGLTNNSGVLFEVDLTSMQYTTLYTFNISADGLRPSTTLAVYNGKLYGGTRLGGNNNLGVLFEWDITNATYTKKIDLATTATGTNITEMLVVNNVLYGTTTTGGTNSAGTIFTFDPATSLYSVKYNNGAPALQSPLTAYNGLLYGFSANNIFSFDIATNNFSNRQSFSSAGLSNPNGLLVVANSLLYFSTLTGGTNATGAIAEFNTTTNAIAVRHSFAASGSRNPRGVLKLHNGLLYGLTTTGGADTKGSVFTFDPATYAVNNIYNNPRFAMVTGFNGFETFTNSVLPVRFARLTLEKTSSKNKCVWYIEATGVDRVYLQQSFDGRAFNDIYNTAFAANGSHDVNKNTVRTFYRLRIVDIDGKITFSNIVTTEDNSGIEIFPTVFTDKIVVQMPMQLKARLMITDAVGTVLYSAKLAAGRNIIETPNLAAGVYFYKIAGNTSVIQAGRLVKF